jgi:ribosomal protein L32
MRRCDMDKLKAPNCPKCGEWMDKITSWTCSNCGGKTMAKKKPIKKKK